MSKTAAKNETIENVEFPSFDASKATDQFRALTEKGMEQSKEAYARMKAGAEDAHKAAETTFETVKAAGIDLSLKTVAAMRAAAEADFAHMESVFRAGSFSEVIELQTSYMRRRIEMSVAQAKEMQAAGSKAAESMAKPAKEAMEKSFRHMKVA